MNFRLNPISKIIDLAVPFIIIGMTILAVNIESRIVKDANRKSAEELVGVIEIAIKNCTADDSNDTLINKILDYMNSSKYKNVVLYDTDLHIVNNIGIEFDLYSLIQEVPDLNKVLGSQTDGHMSGVIGGTQEDIYFKWVNNNSDNNLLVIYQIDENIVDLTNIYLISYSIIGMLFIYMLKSYFVDRMIYTTIISQTQNRLATQMKYRKYDD